MVMVNIESSSGIRSIRLEEQASTPSTPPSGFANVFVDGTPLPLQACNTRWIKSTSWRRRCVTLNAVWLD